MSRLTPAIQRLIADYYQSLRLYLVVQDLEDEDWCREFASKYMNAAALSNHYAAGSIDLDEFELLVGWAIGLS